MKHTLHDVKSKFNEMQQQHQNDITVLTNSLVQLGQRVDVLATDVASQLQQLTSMVHTLMTHSGIPHQSQQLSQNPPQLTLAATSGTQLFDFGTRQLHRNGSGSRSPRRDCENDAVSAGPPEQLLGINHPTQDGIPDLPASFSFDVAGA